MSFVFVVFCLWRLLLHVAVDVCYRSRCVFVVVVYCSCLLYIIAVVAVVLSVLLLVVGVIVILWNCILAVHTIVADRCWRNLNSLAMSFVVARRWFCVCCWLVFSFVLFVAFGGFVCGCLLFYVLVRCCCC